MWFKNLKLYRLAANFSPKLTELEESLQSFAFSPGSSQDKQVSGWVAPFADSGLVYSLEGQILLRLRTQKKLLPSTVINQASRARAAEMEEQQGYKPGRKQLKEIKEQITTELLPRAFEIAHDTHIWLDTNNGWAVIDAAANARSDELISVLGKTISPFPLLPLHLNMSPSAAMTAWLAQEEAPAGFSIDQDIELRANTEMRATVRYVRDMAEPDELRRHIADGKQCTRLALSWQDRISFVLTENMDIKRLAPLDILQNQHEAQSTNESEREQADFALMSAELAHMLDELCSAMGGFKE